VHGLLKRHVSSARRILRAMLEQPLGLEAVQEGTLRGYRILGRGSYLPLFRNPDDSQLPGAWCPTLLAVGTRWKDGSAR
jgi:hypothetical protein